MLQRIVDFSVKQPLWVAILTLALVITGVYQLRHLPIDAVPDITNNQVQVIAVSPSLGAVDVEKLITQPIEASCRNIPGLVEMRSFSRLGLSVITVVFEEEVDIYWARQQVNERLISARDLIPQGLASPYLAPVTTGLGEIYQYVLRAKPGYEARYDLTELRTLQDWQVRRALLGVPGVADVSSFGGLLKQIEISIRPDILQAQGVTLQEIYDAVQANNQNAGGAYIHRDATQLSIRTEGMVRTPQDLESIVVKTSPEGLPLLIKDVAEVRQGHAIRYGSLTYNGQGEVAGGVVMMLKGENSGRVIESVKQKIETIQAGLPEGVELEPFLDRTKMVNSSIQTVAINLAEGALIVVLVLVFFLGNLRAGLLVASVIPLAMLFAVCMMNLFGVSGNLMSLGALDFGLLVDGAVIVVEAVLHRLHVRHASMIAEGRSVLPGQSELKEEVRRSSGKMMGAAFFGQLIILMVYLPILSLQGIEGKMFIPMAQTVLFALLGAFILSLTYVPMMSSLVLRWNAREWGPSRRVMQRLERLQQQILVKTLHRPRPVLVGILLLALGSFALFTTLGGEFIPDLPEGDFAVETKLLPGSNLKTTTDAVLQASALIKERYPEVIKVVGKVGSGEIPTDPMPMEAADLMIILKDPSEWTSASSWEELSARMAATLQEIPGVAFGFQYPVAMRFNELMTGAKQDVVIKIYGENLDSLSRLGKKIGSLVQKVPGAVDVWVETVEGLPQTVVRFDRASLARYGLDIADVNMQIQTAYAGRKVGEMIEDEKRFDLMLRMPDELRQNADAVSDLPIACRDGSRIPLREVATVAVEPGVNQIQRDDARRRLMVGFNVRDRDVQSVVRDVQALCRTTLSLPSGYTLHFGGAFENLQKASARLALVVPLALALIGFLLYLAMGSLRLAALVFVTVPLSAVGGILLLWARGLPFSISAGIGFIVLFGVAVLNGIVLIKEYLSLEEDASLKPRDVVLQGTANRLRPILMTASVASLGFLPMALSQGAGAEVQRPLATVVIGGLLLATLMTLVVLPVLYTYWRHRKTPTNQPIIPEST